MAKGRPTGSSAAPGASMTRAPGAATAATAGTPAVQGHWSTPANMEPGITRQWVAPQAAVPGAAAANPVLSNRDIWARLLSRERNGTLGTGVQRGFTSDGGQRERMDSASYGGRSVGRTGGGLY